MAQLSVTLLLATVVVVLSIVLYLKENKVVCD